MDARTHHSTLLWSTTVGVSKMPLICSNMTQCSGRSRRMLRLSTMRLSAWMGSTLRLSLVGTRSSFLGLSLESTL
ncbi:glyceraldehyde-3-phosphate dehydrogenase b chloroplastic [Phtheirospermum japonicum]|uniref:Glyceraldehyde-3-phosphate dehydrogenase b chloroplastic n=1 Tax=Phtheirospermum japonicum TaxID=374723 RepID=A0A830BTU0_9LAMI|nr:glyceraldehyde-3-phosphate dehydrogenase b chloroplastic [Phtheirospermum japonicum]